MPALTKEQAADVFTKVMSVYPRNVRLVYPGPTSPTPPAMAWFTHQSLYIMNKYDFPGGFSFEADAVIFPYLCLHELGHFEIHPGDGDTGSIIGYALARYFNREYGVPNQLLHHPLNAVSDIIVNMRLATDPNVWREFGKTAFVDAVQYRRTPEHMGDYNRVRRMDYKYSDTEWDFFITWTAMTILKVKDPALFQTHLNSFPAWMKEFHDAFMELVNTLRMIQSDPARFYELNNKILYLMFKNIHELKVQAGGAI